MFVLCLLYIKTNTASDHKTILHNVIHSKLHKPKPQTLQKSLQGFSLHFFTYEVVQYIDYSCPKGTWALPEISARCKRTSGYCVKKHIH